LIACEKAGRQARLVELDPKYVDTTILRWQEFSGGTAVPAEDARTLDNIATQRADERSPERGMIAGTSRGRNSW
jgi:DNA modification methylase